MEKKYITYIMAFLIICFVPSLGLLFGGVEDSVESNDTAAKPALMNETGINGQFLSDAGAYFEDNFAFRNECVTGYAFLMDKLFGVSSENDVIVGSDGWLYYKDSLENYQGSNQMTDRQLFDFAHSLALVKQYTEENNIDFVVTVAPNKNSLYGEHMPYYYQYFRNKGSNLTRLIPYLKAEGIKYTDLYSLFCGEEEVLYHKRDSHWNNKGAAMAADTILTALNKDHISYADAKYEVRKDHEGDLDKMLYPAAVTKEEEIYYNPMPQYTYVEEVESNFTPKIYTINNGKAGSLVMYRDSFGNSLLPFMAEAYGKAYFSRAVPYQIADLKECKADTLVIECAERFLPDMAKNPPIMEAYSVNLKKVDFSSNIIEDIDITYMGETVKIIGKIKKNKLNTNSRIYVRVNALMDYEAFPMSFEDGKEGFLLVLPAEKLYEENNVFNVYITD